ncbi:MAG: adenine phosphoribosyltransferase [Conexivisphaerales archaeon]
MIRSSNDLKSYIREIKDYPIKGVIFRDLTPLFGNYEAFDFALNFLAKKLFMEKIDKVAAIEARGFIVGAPLSSMLRVGFVPIRKAGKLPWKKKSMTYELEYGKETIEVHEDAFKRGENVLLVDDLLATGGTTLAAVDLLQAAGAKVSALAYLVVLNYLNGRERLKNYKIYNVLDY